MGGGVRGGQVHAVSAPGEVHRERAGERRLAHPALAHHHHQPVGTLRERLREPGEGRQGGQHGHRGAARGRRTRGLVREQVAQHLRAQHVEAAQRHVQARQARERLGEGGECLAPAPLQRHGHLVVAQRGPEDAVDGEQLVAQPQLAQLSRGALRLAQRRFLRARHQHHGAHLRPLQLRARVGEALLARGEGPVGPQAGGTPRVGGEEVRPGPRQLQQPQRVAGGRSVEDDVLPRRGPAPVVREQAGEAVEGGDLGGAGARELLAHGGQLLRRHLALHRAEHALAVGLGGLIRVDVGGLQAGHARDGRGLRAQRHAQHLVQVGGGVGAHQEHAAARVRQLDGRGAGERRLADAPLAREEQEARGGGEQRSSG